MKNEKIFPNDNALDEQLSFEAELLANDTLKIVAEMENLDPHLLDDYEDPITSKRPYLQAQFLRDIELSGTDSADMATSLENLDPDLID
jgi:hypothetical protein